MPRPKKKPSPIPVATAATTATFRFDDVAPPLGDDNTADTLVVPETDAEMLEKASLDIDHLFSVLREGNEPLEEVVSKAGRRSKEYDDKKKRAQRLAGLMASLTPQQQRFVTHYVQKDWDSLSEVMIRAGSNAKGESLRLIAWQYLNKPVIKEAIVLSTLRKLEAEGIDRYEIIGMLRDSFNASMADGKYKEANEAAQLLGTGIGLFSPKGVKDKLSTQEAMQIGELNKISRRAGLADPKPSEELAQTGMQEEMANEELSNHLKIAGLALKNNTNIN